MMINDSWYIGTSTFKKKVWNGRVVAYCLGFKNNSFKCKETGAISVDK